MEEMWEIPAGVLEKELTPVENSLKEIEEESMFSKVNSIETAKVYFAKFPQTAKADLIFRTCSDKTEFC